MTIMSAVESHAKQQSSSEYVGRSGRSSSEGKKGKSILFVTDTFSPNINGIVTTIKNIIRTATVDGYSVTLIEPSQSRYKFTLSAYPEVTHVMDPWRVIGGVLSLDMIISRNQKTFPPFDHIHIFTEGSLGTCMAAICYYKQWTFTTTYTTRMPEYLHKHIGLPLWLGYAPLRAFHSFGSRCMISTAGAAKEISQHLGPSVNVVVRKQGVDGSLFIPRVTSESSKTCSTQSLAENPATQGQPLLLSVSRISQEKNLEAFCELPNELGCKILVGAGPHLAVLQEKFPEALHNISYVGAKHGADLARLYAQADVFVFTSHTDTFGVVQAEAMACGTPVAAYRNTAGAKDVITEGVTGSTHEKDLAEAVKEALKLDRGKVADFARKQWCGSAIWDSFREHLQPVVVVPEFLAKSDQGKFLPSRRGDVGILENALWTSLAPLAELSNLIHFYVGCVCANFVLSGGVFVMCYSMVFVPFMTILYLTICTFKQRVLG